MALCLPILFSLFSFVGVLASTSTSRDFPSLSANITAPEPRWPLFNWGTVPVFIHMCNGSGPFNQSTNEYLATFPMVTMEKGQGIYSNGTLPLNYSSQFEESKILEACQAIKRINSSVFCFFYYNSILDWNMYQLHDTLLSYPEYWLRDDSNVVVRLPGDSSFPQPSNGMLVFDYRQQAVRDLWVSECTNMTSDPNNAIDGCFVDRATKNVFPGYNFSEASLNAYTQGHNQVLTQLQSDLNRTMQSVSICKITAPLPPNSGAIAVQLENFTATASALKELRTYAEQGILVQAHAGYKADGNDNHCQNIINSLACFLIGAQRYSYYGCSTGWYIEPDWIVDHAQYHKLLGDPQSNAVLNGNVWSRAFGEQSAGKQTIVDWNQSTGVGIIHWADGSVETGLEGSLV